MVRSLPEFVLIAICCLSVLTCPTAAAEEAAALLQLKELAPGSPSLQSWQAGSDPCSWDRVICEQNQVTAVDLSGVGLQGALPAGWQAPATLKTLDLSDNKQLCGSAPVTQQNTLVVQAAGSGLGQPCSRAAVGAAPAANGAIARQGSSTAQSSISSGAKGAIGGAIAGVGVLAGAAAGTLFFLRKKRRSREQEEGAAGGLDGHDLARACDSVVVTKQKNRIKAAVHNATQQGSSCFANASTEAAGGCGSPRQGAGLRMVAFADGCEDEDKHHLRAANIQDSVVIIRSKMASGQLASHMLGSEAGDGSEHSWSSETEPLGSTGGASQQLLPGAGQEAPVDQSVQVLAGGEQQQMQECHHAVPQHTAVHVEPLDTNSVGALQQRQPILQQSPSKRVQFGAVPVVVHEP